LRRLDDDKSEIDWIVRPLTSVTRGITQIQASASAGRRIVTFFQQTGKRESRFVASDMSHGTLHGLGVLVALRQKPSPSMVDLQMAFGSYEVGVIQRTPVPVLTPETTQYLATLAHRAWSLKYSIDTASETSHAFRLPALLQVPGESLTA